MDRRYPFVYGERERGRKIERRNKRSTSFGKFSIFKQSLDLPEGYKRGCKRDKLRVEGHWWNDLEFAGGVKGSRDFWLLVATQPQASANTS
jgi:hypothetical protein